MACDLAVDSERRADPSEGELKVWAAFATLPAEGIGEPESPPCLLAGVAYGRDRWPAFVATSSRGNAAPAAALKSSLEMARRDCERSARGVRKRR